MAPFVDPQNVRCPKCESVNPLDIVYGLPSAEMHDAAANDVIRLGGCIVDSANPIYECRSCGHTFGELGDVL